MPQKFYRAPRAHPMNTPIKRQPETFTKGHRTFTQLKRVGRVALFQLEEPHWSQPHHEVVILTEVPAREVFGHAVEARERYPRDEDFGSLGWSICALADAEAKFQTLVESEAVREAA